MRTNRVSLWKDCEIVQRWVAGSFMATETTFRRIMGYKDLWALKAILEEKVEKICIEGEGSVRCFLDSPQKNFRRKRNE